MPGGAIIERLRHRHRLLRHLWHLDRRNARSAPSLALLARGFLSNRAWLYPFDRFDPALFLTDLEVEARLPRLNSTETKKVLGDKAQFHIWAKKAGLRTAELIAIVGDGTANCVDGARLDRRMLADRAMIAKPIDGSGGQGVRLVRSIDEVPKAGNFIVEEVLVQHPYAAAIFPDAVNTIRVMFGGQPGKGMTLIGVAHRFGTERSAPTDNFKAGGIVSLIDAKTGCLSEAIADLGGPDRVTFSHHPTSKAAIAGVMIPDWPAVLLLARQASETLDGVSYVGWDIAVTENGPVIVEGNAALANPNLVQFHEPILLRPEVLRFCGETGVLSKGRFRRVQRILDKG
jgi:hypothetical protein